MKHPTVAEMIKFLQTQKQDLPCVILWPDQGFVRAVPIVGVEETLAEVLYENVWRKVGDYPVTGDAEMRVLVLKTQS